MPKNSWLFFAGSSPLDIGRCPPARRARAAREPILLLSGEGVHLALEERVLQRDSRLVDEDGEGLEASEGPAAVRVVAVEDGDRLAVGEQGQQRGLPRLESAD